MNLLILLLIIVLIFNLNIKNISKENMTDTNGYSNKIKEIHTILLNSVRNITNISKDLTLSSFKLNKGLNLNTNVKLNFIPKGTIIMFNGSEPPKGWLLCNGQNGTPDLRNRFIVGIGSNYKLNDTGGADTVVLNVNQLPKHSHSGSCNTEMNGNHSHSLHLKHGCTNKSGGNDRTVTNCHGWEDRRTESAGNHTHTTNCSMTTTGNNAPHENRPPYYALAFIMKAN
jgi:microcystin-dependent protein